MSGYRALGYAGAVAAYAAPPLLLASDLALIAFISGPGLLLQRIALVLFVPAIAGIAVVAQERAHWQVAAGAGLAAIGAAAIAWDPARLVSPTRVPAVLFPAGLLLLAAAMIGTTLSRRAAALIAAGALLFPLAHISGVPAALLGGDVIFIAAFWMLAPRIKSHASNPKSRPRVASH